MSNELIEAKSFLPMPKNFDEAWRLSQVLADSDMVPKDFKGKPGNCMIAMQWGADLGIPGIQALQNIAVVNGRPSIWGDAAKALVIGRADCEDIQEFFEGDGDKLTAVCVVKRKGKSPTTSRFSIADAKAANLFGKPGPWTLYRNRMLQMRARSFALRDAFPDALKGLTIAEEAQDMPVEKVINPVCEKPAAQATNDAFSSTAKLLEAIKTMQVEDFKKIDPSLFSEEDKLTIRKAMTARKEEIAAQRKANIVADVVAEQVIDWRAAIQECGDSQTLQALLSNMPEPVQLEFNDLIDEQFDSFN